MKTAILLFLASEILLLILIRDSLLLSTFMLISSHCNTQRAQPIHAQGQYGIVARRPS